MKVAISLPDPLFEAAEELAEHLSLSRSQLYAQALANFLHGRRAEAITGKLNAVYAAQSGSSGLEAPLASAQFRILDREAW